MIQRRIVVLLLLVILGNPVLATGADSRPAGGYLDYRQMRGLHIVVWARIHAPPPSIQVPQELPLFGTPALVTPASETARVWRVSVVIHEFDTTDHAADAFVMISEGIGPHLADDYHSGSVGTGTLDIQTEALSGIGTRATLTRLDLARFSGSMIEVVTVQRDQYVYYVATYGHMAASVSTHPDMYAAFPTVEIATTIAANGAKDEAPVSFRPDGTSTGGIWGFMPAPGDPALDGLVPIADYAAYVVPVVDAAPRAFPG
jgi:hypothetical protein